MAEPAQGLRELAFKLARRYSPATQGRGHGKDHLFPGVEKVQVHSYRDEAAVNVGGWLSWLTPQSRASSATHRGLDEIVGPFLLRATSSET